MADEIRSASYAFPPYRGPNFTESWPSGTEMEILRRLGTIESALLRIEQLLSRSPPK